MDARTWARAKSILADAAALPAPDRARFLEERCPEPALRRELLAMLASPAPLSDLIADRGLSKGAPLGHYVIESLLGRGGMGEVYRARDSRLGRDVAIKVLPAEVSQDPDCLRRFEREAQMAGALNHPHIAAIYGLERVDATIFLVLELVAGESLAERLEKGPLKLEEALRVAIQIADALDAAHRAGIVHRDLKPGNVMLGKAGAKLLDFGLAKSSLSAAAASSLTEASDLTAPGTIMGTLPYMAPEQIEGRDVDARSDIFSFGCVVYQMLGGRAPFEGATTAKLVAAILERDPPELAGLQPLVPPALERVVRRCLEKEPGARWQTVTDLLAELRWIADGVPSGWLPPAQRRERRIWIAWTAAAACLLGWIVTAVWPPRPTAANGVVVRSVVLPPNDQRFVQDRLAFSPDGTKLAFLAVPQAQSGNYSFNLWVHSFEDGTSAVVPHTTGSLHPFFSSDGRRLAFCHNWESIQTVDLATGALVTVATGGCGAASWNNTDTIVFERRGGIFQVPANGGTAVQILERRPDVAFVAPNFLPDGRHFMVYGNSSRNNEGGLYIAGLDSREARLVLPGIVRAQYAAPGFLVYRRSQQPSVLLAQPFDVAALTLTGNPAAVATGVYAFGVGARGVLAYLPNVEPTLELVWTSRDGAPLGKVSPPGTIAPDHPRLSPDGRRLAYDAHDAGSGDSKGIWVHDLVHDTSTPITSDQDAFPIWSPDGTWLAFTRTPNQIRRKLATGAGQDEALLRAPQAFPRDWSPDGREIIYGRGDTTLAVLHLSPRGDVPFLPSITFDNWDGQFSPDGKWIAYTSSEIGGNDVYVVPYPTVTNKSKVSPDGGAEPIWRRDGRELFYIDRNKRMMSVPVSRDGGGLTFGKPVPLFQSHIANALGISYDVSPNGQRFIIAVVKEPRLSAPMRIVTNWTGLLKK
jgi:serine/threonine protein kinase